MIADFSGRAKRARFVYAWAGGRVGLIGGAFGGNRTLGGVAPLVEEKAARDISRAWKTDECA
jgi:hypothetical protein